MHLCWYGRIIYDSVKNMICFMKLRYAYWFICFENYYELDLDVLQMFDMLKVIIKTAYWNGRVRASERLGQRCPNGR